MKRRSTTTLAQPGRRRVLKQTAALGAAALAAPYVIRSAHALRMPHLRSVRAVHREPRRGDLRYSLADTDKAARLLGYRPTHRIMQGLEKTVEWYVENLFTDTRKRAVNG